MTPPPRALASAFLPALARAFVLVLVLVLVLPLTLTLFPATAAAHSRPLSYALFHVDGDTVDVRVQIAAADLAQLGLDPRATPAGAEGAAQFLERNVTMSVGGVGCIAPDRPVPVPAVEPWLAWRWRVRCPHGGERRIEADLAPLFETGHRQLVRLDDGDRSLERVLELGENSWTVGASNTDARGSELLAYVRLGVEHLLTGWDHLAFLLALLLLAARVRELVTLVTSFTVAHTLSLGLAAAHVVQPSPAPVEALIGLSVALLGIENCWLLSGRARSVPVAVVLALGALAVAGGGSVSRLALAGLALFCLCHFRLLELAREPARLRVALAFAFGLIHGLGFASALAELQLPTGRLVHALFGFNVGLELGQLAVVALAWPLLRALARVHSGAPAELFNETASAAVSGLGLFWFVTRAFG